MYQQKHKQKAKASCRYFLNWITALLCIPLLFSISEVAFSEPSSQQQSEQQLAKLKSNIKQIDRWLTRANTEKTGLSKQLEKQEKKIDQISRDIRHSNAKISKFTKTQKTLEKQHRTQKSALTKQKKYLVKQLQTAYLHGEQTEIKMLLDSDNPQDMGRQMRYFAYINDARNHKIDAFQNKIKEIKKTESEILIQKKGITKNKLTLEKSRNALRQERVARKKVLALLNSNIKNNSQRLTKMKADQSRLEKLLNELETAIANLPLPNNATPFRQQKSKLPWPSHGRVRARFGSRVAQGKLKLNGIHIQTKENTPVTAVHYGRVIFSNWIRGFGLLLIIDHGDDYMSLYGNNKSLIKGTGDWVRSGEIIAYSSESNAKNESGLYFEIRKKGKPQNPSHWLQKSRQRK